MGENQVAMISIIIPAHNAERFILETLRELRTLRRAELIVVCNNCRDSTYQKVEALRARQRNIININAPFYTGKGGAIARGLAAARGSVVGFVDADSAFYPDDIRRAAALTRRYDCVIASKWKGRSFGSVAQPLKRRIYSRVWNALVKATFGLQFRDTQAGLKFFRREALAAIGTDFVCSGFEFDIELLWKLQKQGCRIHEMPVRLRKSEQSTVWTVSTLPMLWNLLRLRLRAL